MIKFRHETAADACTDVNQFSIITELLGTPPDDVIQTIASENVRWRCRQSVFPY